MRKGCVFKSITVVDKDVGTAAVALGEALAVVRGLGKGHLVLVDGAAKDHVGTGAFEQPGGDAFVPLVLQASR